MKFFNTILYLFILVFLVISLYSFYFIYKIKIAQYIYKNRDDKVVETEIYEATKYFYKKLDIQTKEKIRVDIRFFKDKKTKLWGGYIHNKENGYDIHINANSTTTSMILVLAHEMVHLKQYDSGDLYKLNAGHMWKDKYYGGYVKYEDMPWEIEAFKKQQFLTFDYLKHKKMYFRYLYLVINNFVF